MTDISKKILGADHYITKPIDFDTLHTVTNARLAGLEEIGEMEFGRNALI